LVSFLSVESDWCCFCCCRYVVFSTPNEADRERSFCFEALAASLDDEEDKDSGAGFAQRLDEKQQFSAVFEGKARRIAKIMDTRVHQRMEQAQVQWLDSTTAWVGVQDLSGLTQQHVRSLMHGEEDSEDEKDIDEQENVNSKSGNGVANLSHKMARGTRNRNSKNSVRKGKS
jgi:hypothetical protein